MSTSRLVSLVGATGNLGHQIANALLSTPNVLVRVLVRNEASERARALRAAGAEIFVGGLDDEASLAPFVHGAHTVVSSVQGGPDVIVKGQLALYRAAQTAGARRFLPSDYSLDLFRLQPGENPNSDWRRTFSHDAEARPSATQLVHVLCGCFLDRAVLFGFLGFFDLAAGKAFVWGDGTNKMDFTTFADTARYAAVAATADEVPAMFNVAGDQLDFHELVAAYEEASGRKLTIETRGSLADLDATIAERVAAQPSNMFAWLPLMYQRAMLTGRGKLGPLVNQLAPAVHPTTVRDYVRREMTLR